MICLRIVIWQISIILTDNPYSKEAMDVVQNLNKQLETALVGTDLSEAKVALGGIPSQNLDEAIIRR